MEIRPRTHYLAAILWIAAAAPLYPYPLQAEESFSEANTLLFLSDHLHNVAPPATLHYDFRKTGSEQDDFTDSIDIQVTQPQAGGGRSVEMRYFSGDRERYVSPIDNARGNPVIMLFLQRDVREMQRQTQRGWRYFQKLIKFALKDVAAVRTVSIPYAGKTVQGQQIRITPYTGLPEGSRADGYQDKTYLFTLSAGVPGTVYELRTTLGGGAEERLIYAGDRAAPGQQLSRSTQGSE